MRAGSPRRTVLGSSPQAMRQRPDRMHRFGRWSHASDVWAPRICFCRGRGRRTTTRRTPEPRRRSGFGGVVRGARTQRFRPSAADDSQPGGRRRSGAGHVRQSSRARRPVRSGSRFGARLDLHDRAQPVPHALACTWIEARARHRARAAGCCARQRWRERVRSCRPVDGARGVRVPLGRGSRPAPRRLLRWLQPRGVGGA